MGLRDFVVVKWKHSKAEVRLQAVSDMSRDKIDILTTLAESDPSSDVRIAAIKKIYDDTILVNLLKSEPDSSVKECIQNILDRLNEKKLMSASTPKDLKDILSVFTNEKVITDYICQLQGNRELEKIALGYVTLENHLCKVTESSCTTETGLDIVGRIDDKKNLDRIAQKASGKKIRKAALEKYDSLYPERRITERLSEILKEDYSDVKIENWISVEKRILTVESKWDSLDPNHNHTLYKEFTEKVNPVKKAIHRIKEEQIQIGALEKLISTARDLENTELDFLEQDISEIKKQWHNCAVDHVPEMVLNEYKIRFDTIITQYEKTIERRSEEIEKIESTRSLFTEKIDSLQEKIDKIRHFPHNGIEESIQNLESGIRKLGMSGNDLLEQIENIKNIYDKKCDDTRKRDVERVEKEHLYIESLYSDLKKICDDELFNSAKVYNTVKDLKRRWKKEFTRSPETKDKHDKEFNELFDLFVEKHFQFKNELSWKKWSNKNRKSKVLESVEELVKHVNSDGDVTHLGKKIFNVRNEWNRIGFTSKEDETIQTEKFKELCEQLESNVLSRKKELLEQLKSTVDMENNKEATEKIRIIQEEWNNIGFLTDNLVDKELSDHFYRRCHDFFEQKHEDYVKRKELMEQNLLVKQDIVNKAKVYENSEDWKNTINAFQDLQKRWEEAWPAPVQESHELWDVYINSRKVFFDKYSSFKQENDVLKENLCVEAESLLKETEDFRKVLQTKSEKDEQNAESVDDLDQAQPETIEGSHAENSEIAESVKVYHDDDQKSTIEDGVQETHLTYSQIRKNVVQLQRKWKEAGASTKSKSNELWERFQKVCNSIFEIVNAEQNKNAKDKEELVLEAEKLVDSTEWKEGVEVAKNIREKWKAIPPASRKDEQQLWKRLQAALDTFFTRRKEHFSERDSHFKVALERKEELCNILEALVHVAGKGGSLPEEISSGAGDTLKIGMELRSELEISGDPEKTRKNIYTKKEALYKEWSDLGRVPGKYSDKLWKKFTTMLRIIG